MMLKITVLATFLALGACHDTYTGICPNFKAMNTFDWKKFSGRWYAMEKFDTDSRCLTYDFKQNEYDNREVLQTSELDELKKVSINNKVKYRGQLSFPYSSRESDMIVEFPLSILGSASFRVLDTDYDNYALVCTCQEQKFLFKIFTFHRRSCTILQRKPTNTQEYSEEMHDIVRKQFGDEDADHDFDDITHTNCNYEDDGQGLQIDVDEFLETTKDQAGETIDDIEGAIRGILGDDVEVGFGKEVVEGAVKDLPYQDEAPIV